MKWNQLHCENGRTLSPPNFHTETERTERSERVQIDAAVVVRRRRPQPPRPLVVLLRRRLPCPPAAASPDSRTSLFHRPFLLVLPPAPLPPRASSPRALPPGHRFLLPPSSELASSSLLVSFGLIAYCFHADFLCGLCRAVGASAAGAALRQEGGEVARAAHANQVQSQEIQDEGPLVIARSFTSCASHLSGHINQLMFSCSCC